MTNEEGQPTVAELLARIEELEGRLGRKRGGLRRLFGGKLPAIAASVAVVLGLVAAPTFASGPPAAFWSLVGNSGTNPSTNYIGTSDSEGLSIRTNRIQAIGIDANQDVTFRNPINGSITGTASGFIGSLSGDVSGGQSTTKVTGLQGVGISNASPTDGQVLKYNATVGKWEPGDPGTTSGTFTYSPGRVPYPDTSSLFTLPGLGTVIGGGVDVDNICVVEYQNTTSDYQIVDGVTENSYSTGSPTSVDDWVAPNETVYLLSSGTSPDSAGTLEGWGDFSVVDAATGNAEQLSAGYGWASVVDHCVSNAAALG